MDWKQAREKAEQDRIAAERARYLNTLDTYLVQWSQCPVTLEEQHIVTELFQDGYTRVDAARVILGYRRNG